MPRACAVPANPIARFAPPRRYWFIKSPKKAKTKEEIEREKNEEFG
jgi:hypothetical protein